MTNNLRMIRLSLSVLTGALLWLLWQASTVTTAELETIRLRFFLADMLFGFSGTGGKVADFTTIINWRGLLPLTLLFSVGFSILNPLHRIFALFISMLIGCGIGLYFFLSCQLIVPLGGPAILLCCCYLCGTLIHLETEKIERNRSLALDLQQQAENERARIAKDLHDESLPALSRVLRLADQLEQQTTSNGLSKQIRSDLETCIGEMRRVINDLHPAILEDLGLLPAIEQLVDQFRRLFNINIQFTTEGQFTELPKFEQLCVYRIIQEALNNIEKHSRATEASIVLTQNSNTLIARISDNGNGSVSKKPGSFGLQNISHRAKLIGGTVQWTTPDQFKSGTMLTLKVPLIAMTPTVLPNSLPTLEERNCPS